MRAAALLLATLAMLSLVACSGGDDESSAPPPLEERFLTAEDAPDSNPDPVETRQTIDDVDEFIATLGERLVNPDVDEATAILEEAGFVGAGVDTRFYGETHTPGESTHVVSTFTELESDDGATSTLDWLVEDSRSPCPMSCATQISTFDVDDIDDARGVRRVATADDIERVGTTDERPFESYWVAFSVGPVAYTVDLFGLPGSVTEEQAVEIARAYHDRLTSS